MVVRGWPILAIRLPSYIADAPGDQLEPPALGRLGRRHGEIGSRRCGREHVDLAGLIRLWVNALNGSVARAK